jgi:hypothetical protein
MIWTSFAGVVKLFLAGAVVLYAGLVFIALRTEGAHYQVRFDWGDPARSAERLLVAVGVKVVRLILRGLKTALDMLEDTSADVGEWILHHRGM